MGERRVLVIGSQCTALNALSFLPRAAEDLYSVMTDPGLGCCVSALSGEPGLIINPSVMSAKSALLRAYTSAARDGATLFFAYIGHGERIDDDFYLLLSDSPRAPSSDTAVHLTNLIKEVHRNSPGHIDGLGVLVDACYSGVAGQDAAKTWVAELAGSLRFELLTASADRPAANACFSRSLSRLLRQGVPEHLEERLHFSHLRLLIARECPTQIPQHPAYNPDASLWLARNIAPVKMRWIRSSLGEEVHTLTRNFHLTTRVSEVVLSSQEHKVVAVVGEAGVGKSALAAALALPDRIKGVPESFVQAIVLVNEAASPQALARDIAAQLCQSIPEFGAAQRTTERSIPYSEQRRLDSLEKLIVRPLSITAHPGGIRLIIDGLDRLSTGAFRSVMQGINQLVQLSHVRVIVTARLDTLLPESAHVLTLGRESDLEIEKYLTSRDIKPNVSRLIVTVAAGSWLVAAALADSVSRSACLDIDSSKSALSDVYEELLTRALRHSEQQCLRVLTILAVAGAGPTVPLRLLCSVMSAMGSSVSIAELRGILVEVRGLVLRLEPGTDREVVGLFHETFADHIAHVHEDCAAIARGALLDAMNVLAPADFLVRASLDSDIERFAFAREAELLWQQKRFEDALRSLDSRIAPVPTDNLRRWQQWRSRVRNEFGDDSILTLSARGSVAYWHGQSGDWAEALILEQALEKDRARVLGHDHISTLNSRSRVAHWTSLSGNHTKALKLQRALLPDRTQILGAKHPDTLRTRANIAIDLSHSGRSGEALETLNLLLPDMEQVNGIDHRETLKTRASIAVEIGKCGQFHEAVRLLEGVLEHQKKVLRADDEELLNTRRELGLWRGRAGEYLAALETYRSLLPDQKRLLGAYHPDTLLIRASIANWAGKSPDYLGKRGAVLALRILVSVLEDQRRILPAQHSDILSTESWIAYWQFKLGNFAGASNILERVLAVRKERDGEDHPETWTVELRLADLKARMGDPSSAREVFRALLPRQIALWGADHPDVLGSRSHIAGYTEMMGDMPEATRMFEEVLKDYERVLGANHPETIASRNHVRRLRRN